MKKHLILLIFSLLCFCVVSYADNKETGKLTIKCESDGISLKGADLTVYKVADARLSDGTIYYTLVDGLSDLNKSEKDGFFDGMTALESNMLAKKLVLRTDDLINYGTVRTDSKGTATFNLTYGMYLVVETGKTGVSAEYTSYEPFLVSVPLMEDEKYITSVVAKPKTEVEKITTTEVTTELTTELTTETTTEFTTELTTELTTETTETTTETNHPKTGDYIDFLLIFALITGSLGLILVLLSKEDFVKK